MPICTPCQDDLPPNSRSCPVCALPDSYGLICADCLGTSDLPVDQVIAPYRYSYPVNRIIQAMKFQARPDLAGVFARAYRALSEDGLLVMPDRLIPVPLHRSRLQERGYNQSACLAKAFSANTGVPTVFHLLQRLRPTVSQTGLNRARRRMNVKGAFSVNKDASVAGLHIVLIDDVMTTGATLREAAKVLKHAGASRVDAWVCARAGQA